MRNSHYDSKPFDSRFIDFIAIAAVFALFQHQSFHAADAHSHFPAAIRLTQRLAATGEYDADCAIDSTLLDARLKLSVPDMGDLAPQPDSNAVRVDSFGFRITPIPRLAIHVGALTVAGLPARAKNPLFYVSSPFHDPVDPSDGPTFALGTAKKTDNGAIEWRTTGSRIAACTTTLNRPLDSAWISAAREFRSFSEENDYLVLSLFSGIKRIDPKQETSWFVNEPLAPQTSILMPGAECLFRKGAIGGSLTGFGNFASARKPDALSRSELFVDDGIFRLSGGYCRTGRHFLDFDGESTSVLSRFFLSPQCKVGESWTLGGILVKDTVRGEKYYCENLSAYAGGGGIKFEDDRFRFRFQAMRKEETTSLSAAAYHHAPGLRFLSASALASCEIPGSKPDVPEHIKLSGKLGIHPFQNRPQGFAASIGYDGSFTNEAGNTTAAVHKGSLEIDGFFSARHFSWRCALKGSLATDGSQPEGCISLELDFP